MEMLLIISRARINHNGRAMNSGMCDGVNLWVEPASIETPENIVDCIFR